MTFPCVFRFLSSKEICTIFGAKSSSRRCTFDHNQESCSEIFFRNCFERFCKAVASKRNLSSILGQNQAVQDAHWTKSRIVFRIFFWKFFWRFLKRLWLVKQIWTIFWGKIKNTRCKLDQNHAPKLFFEFFLNIFARLWACG